MIVLKTCRLIACDDCKKTFEHDDQPHFDSAQAARWEVEESEWWWDGAEVDLCSECKWKPHPFRLKPDTTEECWRCPHPFDEHDTPPAPAVRADS